MESARILPSIHSMVGKGGSGSLGHGEDLSNQLLPKKKRTAPSVQFSKAKHDALRLVHPPPLTLTHSPHPLPLAEHIYLRASLSAFSPLVIRPRRAP